VTEVQRDQSWSCSQDIRAEKLQHRELSVVVRQGEVLKQRAWGRGGQQALLQAMNPSIPPAVPWESLRIRSEGEEEGEAYC
jgi:hypothetical protein